MKKVVFYIKGSNLSSYVDIFVNHGKLENFSWLIAHHLSFFGDFDNLLALDVLLKNRRGFNLNLPSKKRKKYFSDVNIILKKCGEFKINCCEAFKPTIHIGKTKETEELQYPSHSISEIERFEIIEEEGLEEPPISDPVIEELDRSFIGKFNTIRKESTSRSNNEGMLRFLKGIQEFLTKGVEDIFTESEIKEIISIKGERASKLTLLNSKINDLRREIIDLPPKINITINQNVSKRVIENSFLLFHMMDLFKKCFLPRSKEFLDAFYAAEKEYFNELRSKGGFKSEKYRMLVKDMLSKRDFRFPDEIMNLCKGIILMKRSDHYNEALDELDEHIKQYKKCKANNTVYPKIREMNRLNIYTKGIEKDLNDSIKSQEMVDKTWGDLDTICKPINFKRYSNLCNNGRYSFDENDEIDEWILNGRSEEVISIIDTLKKDLMLRVDNSCFEYKKVELKNTIDDIRNQFGHFIALKISQNEEISNLDAYFWYSKIVSERVKYINFIIGEKANLDFHDLALSEDEGLIIDSCVNFIKSEEKTYEMNKELIKERDVQLIYCDQNLRIHENEYGISSKLPCDEWIKEVFEKVEGPIMKKQVERYETCTAEFERITGFSPIGLICGSIFIDKVKLELKEGETKEQFVKREKKFMESEERRESERRSMQEEKIFWKLDETECEDTLIPQVFKNIKLSIEKGVEHITNSNSHYLYNKNKSGLFPNYNFKQDTYKDRLLKGIEDLEKEVSSIDKRGSNEVIYDIVKNRQDNFVPSDNHGKHVGFKSGLEVRFGRRIENELKVKYVKKKKATEMFVKTVESVCKASKNIYSELEVEEAIVNSNGIVNEIFTSDLSPYLIYDYSKYKEFRKLKKKIVKDNFDEERPFLAYNDFDIKYKSNSNKNYNVVNCISYLKTILALKLLRVSPKKAIYQEFGLKKCQSFYMIRNFVRTARKSLKLGKIHISDDLIRPSGHR